MEEIPWQQREHTGVVAEMDCVDGIHLKAERLVATGGSAFVGNESTKVKNIRRQTWSGKVAALLPT